MDTFTVLRDGQRTIRFVGERLAEASGRLSFGEEQYRWYELTLYRHENRRYVVAWRYHTHWQGEMDHAQVETYATLKDAFSALEAFDPCAWIEGYRAILARHAADQESSAMRGYAVRQAALEQQITQHYRTLVQQLAQALALVEEL